MIPTGRSAEEIDDGDLLLHRIQEPAIFGRVAISAHELIVDDIIMIRPVEITPDPMQLAVIPKAVPTRRLDLGDSAVSGHVFGLGLEFRRSGGTHELDRYGFCVHFLIADACSYSFGYCLRALVWRRKQRSEFGMTERIFCPV